MNDYVHLFSEDYCDHPLFEEDCDNYNETVDEYTIVVAYCGAEVGFKDVHWTYQHQFTTCEDCKADFALELLGDLP